MSDCDEEMVGVAAEDEQETAEDCDDIETLNNENLPLTRDTLKILQEALVAERAALKKHRREAMEAKRKLVVAGRSGGSNKKARIITKDENIPRESRLPHEQMTRARDYVDAVLYRKVKVANANDILNGQGCQFVADHLNLTPKEFEKYQPHLRYIVHKCFNSRMYNENGDIKRQYEHAYWDGNRCKCEKERMNIIVDIGDPKFY